VEMQEGTSKVAELEAFRNELVEYDKFYQRHFDSEELTRDETRRLGQLYENISCKVGSLGPLITELTGIDKIDIQGRKHDMWLIALSSPMDPLAYRVLGDCIHVVNRAIGRLEADIQRGYRDKNGDIKEKAGLSTISGEKSKSVPKKVWRWAKANKLWSIIIIAIPVIAALLYVIDYFWKLFS